MAHPRSAPVPRTSPRHADDRRGAPRILIGPPSRSADALSVKRSMQSVFNLEARRARQMAAQVAHGRTSGGLRLYLAPAQPRRVQAPAEYLAMSKDTTASSASTAYRTAPRLSAPPVSARSRRRARRREGARPARPARSRRGVEVARDFDAERWSPRSTRRHFVPSSTSRSTPCRRALRRHRPSVRDDGERVRVP